MKTIIAVNGACGRMGQRIVQLAREDKELQLGAALEMAGHPQLGRDIGEVAGVGALGVWVSNFLPPEQRVEVVLDFSTPEGTMAVLPVCLDRKVPLVVATTGHTPAQKREIEAAAHHIGMLMAPNMSLAVNVLMALARQAARLLREHNFDVEILERHHRFALSVTMFQVAIALSAIAALTRRKALWWVSLAAGGVGLAMFVRGFLAVV